MPSNTSSHPIQRFEGRQSDSDDDDDDNSTSSHSRHTSATGTKGPSLPNPSGSPNRRLGNRSNSGAIAGGIIGCICGLALILFFFWWWRRRTHRSRSRALVDIDEPMHQTTSAMSSKDRDQLLATPFVGGNMAGVRQTQDESYNQYPSRDTETVFQAGSQTSHVHRVVSNPDSPSEDGDPTPPSLSKAAFFAHQKGSDVDPTGPSSWKRNETRIVRSRSSFRTAGTSQGSENGSNVHITASNSLSSRRSLDIVGATSNETPPDTRDEKRPPPQVRLSIDGLFVDGRRVSDADNDDDGNGVADLYRRIEVLTQENALLALRAEAPPAYQ